MFNPETMFTVHTRWHIPFQHESCDTGDSQNLDVVTVCFSLKKDSLSSVVEMTYLFLSFLRMIYVMYWDHVALWAKCLSVVKFWGALCLLLFFPIFLLSMQLVLATWSHFHWLHLQSLQWLKPSSFIIILFFVTFVQYPKATVFFFLHLLVMVLYSLS